MPSPFPGMDPYLEDSDLWNGLALSLMVYAAETLQSLLPSGYYAEICEADPDARPGRPSVEIRTLRDHDCVTVLELIGPVLKSRHSPERAAYQSRQRGILMSTLHLVEFDLGRGGTPMGLASLGPGDALPRCDYTVCISRAEKRPRVEVYAPTWSWTCPRSLSAPTTTAPTRPASTTISRRPIRCAQRMRRGPMRCSVGRGCGVSSRDPATKVAGNKKREVRLRGLTSRHPPVRQSAKADFVPLTARDFSRRDLGGLFRESNYIS
jgi:hypothetical protein